MLKIVYGQMPALQEVTQQISVPLSNIRMQKLPDGDKILAQIPGVHSGGDDYRKNG